MLEREEKRKANREKEEGRTMEEEEEEEEKEDQQEDGHQDKEETGQQRMEEQEEKIDQGVEMEDNKEVEEEEEQERDDEEEKMETEKERRQLTTAEEEKTEQKVEMDINKEEEMEEEEEEEQERGGEEENVETGKEKWQQAVVGEEKSEQNVEMEVNDEEEMEEEEESEMKEEHESGQNEDMSREEEPQSPSPPSPPQACADPLQGDGAERGGGASGQDNGDVNATSAGRDKDEQGAVPLTDTSPHVYTALDLTNLTDQDIQGLTSLPAHGDHVEVAEEAVDEDAWEIITDPQTDHRLQTRGHGSVMSTEARRLESGEPSPAQNSSSSENSAMEANRDIEEGGKDSHRMNSKANAADDKKNGNGQCSRYKTVSYRRIRKGNTRQRIDEFEAMMDS
ncbi:cilia- and flagella-associated protein 251-like [Cheilinus undulatus]|uniref:cilia- and flagella-associated protein 251-like n=1 Tax=Cheilinus undulatus TaxID=241271 RepID=UPI001BD428E2|nr:cilia- and flagella-associated protein 251-like [Cheilinus undulatus]